MSTPTEVSVFVPPERWGRWLENFGARHGEIAFVCEAGTLIGRADDGSHFVAAWPFSTPYDGAPDPREFSVGFAAPDEWGVVLVRKGGFAIARLRADHLVEHKVGQRHVQGRTKAGGQSQQRFARRRDNQARQAFEAAADHAVRILGDRGSLPVVLGGDGPATREVLAHPRLASLEQVGEFLTVADPRRKELDQAIERAQSLFVRVTNVG